MSIVALEEIRRSFWRKEAVLAGVTLHAEPGEVVGLLGRSPERVPLPPRRRSLSR